MTPRFLLLLGALLSFAVYSIVVVAGPGYFGFLELARREPWALQMLLDLTIVLVLFLVWAYRDARPRAALCAGRRMNDIAVRLVDELLPLAPYRQWVFCSFPWRMRVALAYDTRLLSEVLGVCIVSRPRPAS